MQSIRKSEMNKWTWHIYSSLHFQLTVPNTFRLHVQCPLPCTWRPSQSFSGICRDGQDISLAFRGLQIEMQGQNAKSGQAGTGRVFSEVWRNKEHNFFFFLPDSHVIYIIKVNLLGRGGHSRQDRVRGLRMRKEKTGSTDIRKKTQVTWLCWPESWYCHQWHLNEFGWAKQSWSFLYPHLLNRNGKRIKQTVIYLTGLHCHLITGWLWESHLTF